MSDLIDKLQKNLDRGIGSLSSKVSETMETMRIKSDISRTADEIRQELLELGNDVFSMYLEDVVDKEKVWRKCATIKDLKTRLAGLEHRLSVVRQGSLSQVITCAECGTALTPEMQFCSGCGKKAPADLPQNTCSNCGTELPPQAKFCRACGAKVTP